MVTMILDGYNVIHAVPELAHQLDRSLQSARDALVNFCQAYHARRGSGQMYIVFDGQQDQGLGFSGQSQQGVSILFTQKPEEADQRILSVIEAQRGRSQCVVVSNDNEVANNARAFGARIMSAQEFYAKARQVATPGTQTPTSTGKKQLSPRDAQYITDEYRKHLDDAA